MSENKGYLVVEQNKKIIYADSKACELTEMDKSDLRSVDPENAVNDLSVEKVKLEAGCELWILKQNNAECEFTSELEQMNERLENALKAAEAANRAKSSFLSNMSHDIRTPMNAIMGMTSIGLSHIDEKARVQDCLLKIKTASTHLMSLVNDVLDMSRIDSGRMTLNEEEFSIADLVHDIAVIMRPQAVLKDQELQIDIGRIYEENLIGDALRLRQILVNIIGNAVKYTPDKGKINVYFAQYLKTGRNRNCENNDKVWLDFICEDNGIGMSREFLKRIFLPFERVNNSTIGKIEGTGLGMSIVKNLVEQMGGTIRVDSEEGKGSKFHVEIPISASLKNDAMPELPVGSNVILVENKNDRVRQISDFLNDAGLKTVIIRNGLDAVTTLTENKYEEKMPCAILLGQEIDDIPVLELASHIRQLAGSDFPIILVSEEDWGQIEYPASRAGIKAFVPCPLFKSRLLKTLSELTKEMQISEKITEDYNNDFSKYRILLVEDVEINQEIVVEMLSVTGVQVEVADNGAKAVEMFKSSDEGYYDLIFMDIQMPIMNGYEATKLIRQLPRSDSSTVWIVAMTANAFVEDIRMSREAGMNEHCSKPVDPERLGEIMRNRLKQHER